MVLTCIAYLAQRGYKGLDVEIRPYISAAMLYFISFGMMGAGLFLQRKFEFLKNYSDVITGGGMTALYFTTYALYFIKSPNMLGHHWLGRTRFSPDRTWVMVRITLIVCSD